MQYKVLYMDKHLDDLKHIRGIMERSTKFLSLSGYSGIFAGLVATVGGILQLMYMKKEKVVLDLFNQYDTDGLHQLNSFLKFTFINFSVILSLALLGAFYFTYAKARKTNKPLFDSTTYRLALNFGFPLVCGGLLVLYLFSKGFIGFLAPISLIFYGISIFNASNFTYSDTRYLGVVLTILGFVNLLFIGFGIYFWILGFGLAHIFYGFWMYFKYEK